MSQTVTKHAWLFLVVSAVCWSMGGLLVKASQWNPFSLAITRGTISFFVYCLIVRRRPKITGKTILGGLCYVAQGTLITAAYKHTTAGNACMIQNTSPLFIIALNYLVLRKKPKRLEFLTCFFLLSGIGLCLVENKGSGKITGDLMAVVSMLFYGGMFFVNHLKDVDPMDSLLIGNGAYVLMLPLLLLDPAVPETGFMEMVPVLGFCLITGTIAWYFFSLGIKRTDALSANFFTMLEPVLTPVWTLVFMGERMGALSVLGFAVVILTLIVYNIEINRKHVSG
jgi:drug/metabolite transporter (DMT)-like permease